MARRNEGRIWRLLLIILVAVAAGLAGYYMGMKKGREEENVSVSKKIPEENKAAPSVASKAPEKETMVRQEIKEPDVREKEDYCAQTENGVQGFFRYLNTKSYVQHLEPGMDTYDHFRRLIQQLSAQPPIPAGEGVDTKIIIKNIFYFSRLLEKKDLMLIKEIMRNEGDTLELNLQMFYKWFMLGDECPNPKGIRPSLETLYQCAGFLLNTVGGKSYLSRRPLPVRLLVSYYCLLIIHDADKKGKNSYGIDIFPEIVPLAKEISLYPDFRFQQDYLNQLTILQDYYLAKR